ncbi:hypothetical protein H5410_062947 [Solanum commersonii]|uniref:Uncharacterized protein n=1 Tax=Solanum commersonii TaxID=4109 RepID=A0A9J5WCD3_SOLCO|nr:hypothetical protein H5410_062947 [Solanum commersonii]
MLDTVIIWIVPDTLAKRGSKLTNYDKAIFLQSLPEYIKDQLAKDKNIDISIRLIRPFMCNKLAQFGNLPVITSPPREYVLANSSVIP